MLWSDLCTARVFLTDAAMCINLTNESWVNTVISCYFVVTVIFYCSNTTAFDMSDWKFSKGGRLVKLGCKMGRRMKKVENH